jgi:hypothetical protein
MERWAVGGVKPFLQRLLPGQQFVHARGGVARAQGHVDWGLLVQWLDRLQLQQRETLAGTGSRRRRVGRLLREGASPRPPLLGGVGRLRRIPVVFSRAVGGLRGLAPEFALGRGAGNIATRGSGVGLPDGPPFPGGAIENMYVDPLSTN